MGALKILAVALVLGLAFCPLLTGQKHPRHPTSVPDLFNQVGSASMLPKNLWVQSLIEEAEASDTREGLQKYSEYLITLVVGEQVKSEYISTLSKRLIASEQMTRDGKRKLISENSIVDAFNQLMKQVQISAAPALVTNVTTVHQLREVLYNTSSSLSSLKSSDSDCHPTEAALLMVFLLRNNGAISSVNSASSTTSDGHAAVTISSIPLEASARGLVNHYSATHSEDERAKLYEDLLQIILH